MASEGGFYGRNAVKERQRRKNTERRGKGPGAPLIVLSAIFLPVPADPYSSSSVTIRP